MYKLKILIITTFALLAFALPAFAQPSQHLHLLTADQAVQVREIDRDCYGRTVAESFLGNQSVKLMIGREGQAVVYSQYLESCAATKDQDLTAQPQANVPSLGFWSQWNPWNYWNQWNPWNYWNQPNPMMPWYYRTSLRWNTQPSCDANPNPKPTTATSHSGQQTLTPTPTTGGLPPCTKSDCDCKDFKTRAEAQRVLDAFPGDPFRLDKDKDGIACELLS